MDKIQSFLSVVTFLSWTAVEESMEVCSTVGKVRGRMEVSAITRENMEDMMVRGD